MVQVFQPQSVCFMTKGMIIRDMMNSMMSHIIVILVRGCYKRPVGGVGECLFRGGRGGWTRGYPYKGMYLYLDGSFEVVAEFFSDFVCEAVAELGEDVFVEDGPYEFVVEIGGAFCSGGAWSFAILDIEEAEV